MSAAAARRRSRPAAGPSRGDLINALAGKVFTCLVLASIAVYFLLSDMVLSNLGVNYADGAGNPLEKIHPGTWLAFIALLFMGVRHGNPLRLADVIVSHRGLALFMLSWAALFAWVTLVMKAPFTPLIDTFLGAMAVFLLFTDLSPASRRKLALMVHAFMIANAVIGLVEYVTQWRLTPYTIAGVAQEVDWRSTAILGHPLGNSALTGAYAVAIALGGARDLPKYARAPLLALELTAMIGFGGRTSLLNALVIIALVSLWRLFNIMRGARFDRLSIAAGFLLAPLLVAGAAAAASSGFFANFIERLNDDSGSTQARFIMLNFFNVLPMRDILFGADPALLASLQYQDGIELGLESFFIGFILAYGAIMANLFFLGLFAFCRELVRMTRPALWLALMFYFVVAATSVSLSVKTITFSIFVAMMLSLMRPMPGDAEHAEFT